MSIYRFIIFYPQGDIEEYTGIIFPSAKDYPINTWVYVKESVRHSISPWMQSIQYTPTHIDWEMYDLNSKVLNEVTQEMKMKVLLLS